MTTRRLEAGKPYPLGATWDGSGVNFALFSGNATRVELCLFDPSGRHEVARRDLSECTNEVWHGFLPDAQPGLLYGYRVHGPHKPEQGHRFNPNKLLLDPYAKQLQGQLQWSDRLWGYRMESSRADLSLDRRDSATVMPKAVVVHDAFPWGDVGRPRVEWADTVIYEAHVRGLSMRRDGIQRGHRGTFAALSDPWFVEHLVRLGVTAVELMPVHAFVDDRHLVDAGLRNYWGYNTLCFFAPEPRYLSGRSTHEIRAAVRRLHEAGIEVLLDVVYNHTCEGNELGPTLSFRGIDNASYYRLIPDQPRYYINETGCGNTLNLSHPRVLQMVLDSLRYWAEAYRVDGFRFDLGVTLGREPHGFDPGSGFFDAILQDPVLSRLKLISEPWDVGPGGYQLGAHPPAFAEWNDRFRDTLRRFWRGEEGMRGELAARLAASSDLFDRRGRKPWATINYAASHDGFTLADLVTYAEKHNEANGEDNRDGHNANFSANWGTEGPTDDPDIVERRGRVQRAMLATVMLAHGTPMLLAGDEMGRTQRGNNNAYCQDNEITWIDWAAASQPPAQALIDFTARLSALRRRFPVLRSRSFLHSEHEVVAGVRDIEWFDAGGRPMTPEAWNEAETRTLALRRAGPDGRGAADVLLMLLNAGPEESDFTLPEPVLEWRVVLESAAPQAAERAVEGREFRLAGHSVALLHARTAMVAE